MEVFTQVLNSINSVIWHDYVLYIVLGTGVLFTFWSGFSQYRAVTHGVSVTLGRYDDKRDPGAISHFQALSAALSATVGLGNIGGVALAIALGGPGAVFWMWMIGLAGMALKTTEVTLSMLYRNTDDPDNPHGGPMFVAAKAFEEKGLPMVGKFVGGLFVVTLLISTITGGNMFQAWNVADITHQYFDIPQIGTGIFLSVLVGLVIIGGIKRIGSVAGRLVPFMGVLYLLGAVYVLVVNFGVVPDMLRLIVTYAFSPAQAEGAFIGGTAGYAFLWGMKRALFSSESGQGSSPIAHSAAKTNEPVREAVVAGLEPFIDTLVVCTLTTLVILATGVWDRGPDVTFTSTPEVVQVSDGMWSLERTQLVTIEDPDLRDGADLFVVIRAGVNPNSGEELHRLSGLARKEGEHFFVDWSTHESSSPIKLVSQGAFFNYKGATLTAKAFDRTTEGLGKWLVTVAAWLFAISTMISWSYYGEQGVVFLAGEKWVKGYKLLYCGLIIVATIPALISTDAELDALTALGTGVMLWANIPIMLIFGTMAMRAYWTYMGKLKAGEFRPH
ncbi:MAG: amino acid carrier protein [Ignavibacteria bacterium]|nr:amino acid carrier protein [Ignavibacteria bacterium]